MRPRLIVAPLAVVFLTVALIVALLPIAPAAAVSDTVVISELHTATVAGDDADAYVELHNVADVAQDISGWRLDRCNDRDQQNQQAAVHPGTVLAPGERYLFTAPAYDYGVPGDQTMATSIAPLGGALLLDADGQLVDGVAYSAGPCTEGVAATRPADTSQAVARDTAGTDTDDNATDFTTQAPTPEASSGEPSTTVVVNELRPNTGAGTNDGFVELRNVSAAPVDVSGWRVDGCNGSAVSGTRATVTAGVTLAPGEHYLLTSPNSPANPGDQTFDVGIAADGGMRLFDAGGILIDGVGLTADQPCTETAAAPSPGADGGQSSSRSEDPTTDTNDNASDFSVGVATPTASDADPDPTPDPGTGEPIAATVAPDDLVVEQIYEAEDLLPAVEDTANLNARPNCCGIIRSNDASITLGRAEDGDTFTLAIDVPADGTYELGVDYTVDPSFGIAQLSIDGTDHGEPFDSYNPVVATDRRATYPPLALSAGEHQLTFTVRGNNPQSTGYRIGMDLFRLRRLPDPGRLALTPGDGAAVRGLVPILGYSTAPDDTLSLSIDGAPVDGRSAIGGESASLIFEAGGTNGIQSSLGFLNRIRVRGQEIALASDVQGDDRFPFPTDTVDIPGELLTPGSNVVTVVAGELPGSSCNNGQDGPNRDDFTIRNVRLELPDGTVLSDPAMTGSYDMGDGLCGSANKPIELDFTFEIPPPDEAGPDYDPARGFVWDSTEVPDGFHTVTLDAAGAAGAQAQTHRVLVDNTSPTITSTSPQQGQQLKGEFTIDATATDGDGSGVETITATLDGEEVEVPSTALTDDLTAGEHTFVFTTTDAAGNQATTTVTATTVPEQPDSVTLVAPPDGATGVPTDPELSVTATDPAGDPLTVTFFEATASVPQPGAMFSGSTATAPPSELSPAGEEAVGNTGAVLLPDDDYLDTGPSDAFPYQRFDLQLDDGAAATEGIQLSWEGRTDPAREVALYAYDMRAAEWVELDRGRGLDDGDLELQGEVTAARYDDNGVVHVLVQGSDPFADDIADEPDEQFRDPDTYDFSLAWMTDTQYLSEGAEEGRPGFAEAYTDINTWIVDNAETRKIVYASHTGDLINNWISTGSNGDTPEYEARARREFQFSSDTMDILEDAGIPYGVTPGNHDNKFGTTNELYNEYFSPERFEAASDNAAQDYYGGPGAPGDNQNHVDLFTAGGQDFVVVYLGFIAGQDEIDWANQTLAQYADRKAIFATHEYLRPSNNPDGRDGALSDENERSQGVQLFEEVVLPNENVFLTLSGHTHGVALNIRRNQGPQGRTVVEMLANYQFYRVDGERRVGHFRLLQFDLERSEMSVNTYSPVLDDFNANEYDTSNNRDYTPAADEFTVPVDLQSRVTSFATDAVRLEGRTAAVIGTDEIASSSPATTVWSDRALNTEYAWYARAQDDFGGSIQSDVFTFTTGAATPPPGPGPNPDDTTAPAPPTIVRPPDIDDNNEDAYPVRGDAETESTVTVTVTATDADGNEVVGADRANSPYEVALDVSGLTDGRVTLTATSTDAAGNTSKPTVAAVDKATGAGTGPPDGRQDPPPLTDPPPTDPSTPTDPPAITGDQTVRIAGPTRIETALEASRQSFGDGQAGAVVLTRADLFPDALAGTPLAVQAGAPLLLTPSDGLDDRVAAEVQRVLPAGGTVHLLGGTAALAEQVANDVSALGFDVVRHGGSNRFATAAVIAEVGLESPATVILADGANFPDAVTAGAAAGHTGAAVLLTGSDTMPAETRAYLQAHTPEELFAAGGPAARAAPTATGLVGADRIQTSVRVAEQFFDGPPVVGIATAAAFPDALAGGAVVAPQGGPVLLTFGDQLEVVVEDYLSDNAAAIDGALVFGGTAAISDDVVAVVGAAIQD